MTVGEDKNKKQEEVKYAEGEERLIWGEQRNEFAGFELKLRMEKDILPARLRNLSIYRIWFTGILETKSKSEFHIRCRE
jgi:hypothetical protein